MSDELRGLTAIAWSLFGDDKTKGNRVYRIMLLDQYVAVGSGTDADHLTYKVYKLDTAAQARDFSIRTTGRIERLGFTIYHQPMFRVVEGGKRSWLDSLVGTRTRNDALTASVRTLLVNGKPLEPQVDIVA